MSQGYRRLDRPDRTRSIFLRVLESGEVIDFFNPSRLAARQAQQKGDDDRTHDSLCGAFGAARKVANGLCGECAGAVPGTHQRLP